MYIVSRKDTSAFAAELTSRYSGEAHSLQADLTDLESVDVFTKEFSAHEDKLHVLVNNSGTNWAEPIETYSPKGWDKVYALNVRAVFLLVQKMLPLLEKAASKEEPSRVINISSIDSLRTPSLDTYAYSSGKAAVTHLSKVLAGRLGERNITVNAVLPGAFPSRMMRATLEAAGDALARATPLGRVGSITDMVGVTLMLAGRGGRWMTGAQIVLDGGAVCAAKM